MADPVIPVQDILIPLSDGRTVEARPVRVVDATMTPNAAGQMIDVQPVYVVDGSGGGGGSGGITSSASTVPENTAIGTDIATLSVFGWSSVTFAIIDGENAGGRLSIVGDKVRVAGAINYEQPTLNLPIRVRALNTGNPDYEAKVATLNFAVVNVPETTLNTLTVSSLAWSTGAATGATLFTVGNGSAGSTFALFVVSGQSGRVALDGTTGKKTGLGAVDGNTVFVIREFNPDALNNDPGVNYKQSGPFTGVWASAPAYGPFTWDPVTKGDFTTLSASDLLMTVTGGTGSQYSAARSNADIQEGIVRFEFLSDDYNFGQFREGWVNANQSLNSGSAGDDANGGVALPGNGAGQYRLNGANTAVAPPLVTQYTGFEVNNDLVPKKGRIVRPNGTYTEVSLPTGFVLAFASHRCGATHTVRMNAGLDPAGPFTGSDGGKWFTPPTDWNALKPKGPSTGGGGGGDIINIATVDALTSALANPANAGKTLSLTTPGLDYGQINKTDVIFNPGITIAYLGTGTRPKINGWNLLRCEGFNFQNVEVTHRTVNNWSAASVLWRLQECTKCSVLDCDLRGGVDVVGETAGSAAGMIRGSTFCAVAGGTSKFNNAPIVIRDSHDIIIDSLDFDEVWGDAIQVSYNNYNITINACTFTNFRVSSPDAHPDCIQFFSKFTTTVMYNITITNNAYNRGSGALVQFVFFGREGDSPLALPYDNVLIEGNQSRGSMWNSIAIGTATNVKIRNNFVQGWPTTPDQNGFSTGSWITAGVSQPVELSNNQSTAYLEFSPGSGHTLNVPDSQFTTNAGNTIIAAGP